MDDDEKALVLDLHYDGELSEVAARELLGDAAFEDTQERARGVDMMLSGDAGRFLTNDDEKTRVYRRYLQGSATEEDVRDVFGDDFEDFENRREFMEVVKDTPTNPATDDLVTDGQNTPVIDRDVTVIDVYAAYAREGNEPAEVADELDIPLARVHESLAYYYRHAEEMRRIEQGRDGP